MKEYIDALLEIKEDLGEIKADIKDLNAKHVELQSYLKSDVKPVVDTYQKYNWLGNKFLWVMGLITLSGSVIAAIKNWR